MSTLLKLEALQEAIVLITGARVGVARGSSTLWGKLDRAAKYLDQQVELLLQPTLNERTRQEQEEYAQYQRELAMVEWTFAEERRAVYGAIPADRRPLTEAELCRTWPEWLGMQSAGMKQAALAEEAEQRLWSEECDQLYAAEELERMAMEQQEVRDDR